MADDLPVTLISDAQRSRLFALVAQARVFVQQASAEVSQGATCASWILGDASGCTAQTHLVEQLAQLVAKLDDQAQAAADDDDVRKILSLADDVEKEARSLTADADFVSWSNLTQDIADDLGHDIGAVASGAATIAGKGLWGALSGLASGLGPLGTIFVGGVLVVVLTGSVPKIPGVSK